MGAMTGETQLGGGTQHMTLVAAGGFANDEQRTEPFLAVLSHLGAEAPAHGGQLVGDHTLLVRRQGMHDESFLGDLERNDMVEGRARRDHSWVCHSGVPGLYAAVKASLPFGWPERERRGGEVSCARSRGLIPAPAPRRPKRNAARV